jgi:protein-disulfide isomerase
MLKAYRVIAMMFLVLLMTSLAAAEIQKDLLKRVPLGKTPLDIAQSVRDGRIFVLLEGGDIQILSPEGQKLERFKVSADTTSIEIFPDGQRIYLGNSKSNEVQIFNLSSVTDLPIGRSAIKGDPKAPVTITIFDDFQCPYCAKLVPTIEKVVEANPKQVKVVFKHFPLSMHKFARQAAIASIAARNQGKFWPMHDELFANYNKLNDAKIRELAEKIGLNMNKFDADIANPALQQEINLDMQLGTQAGVRGTPAVYINGKQARDRSFEGLQKVVREELKK